MDVVVRYKLGHDAPLPIHGFFFEKNLFMAKIEFLNLKLIKTGIVKKLKRGRFSTLLIESIIFTTKPLILWFLLD